MFYLKIYLTYRDEYVSYPESTADITLQTMTNTENSYNLFIQVELHIKINIAIYTMRKIC